MINQWEYVDTLKCPIPTEEIGNSTLPTLLNSTLVTLVDSTISTALDSSFDFDYGASNYRVKPFYCIESGAEILDDLKIRPVRGFYFLFLKFLFKIFLI